MGPGAISVPQPPPTRTRDAIPTITIPYDFITTPKCCRCCLPTQGWRLRQRRGRHYRHRAGLLRCLRVPHRAAEEYTMNGVAARQLLVDRQLAGCTEWSILQPPHLIRPNPVIDSGRAWLHTLRLYRRNRCEQNHSPQQPFATNLNTRHVRLLDPTESIHPMAAALSLSEENSRDTGRLIQFGRPVQRQTVVSQNAEFTGSTAAPANLPPAVDVTNVLFASESAKAAVLAGCQAPGATTGLHQINPCLSSRLSEGYLQRCRYVDKSIRVASRMSRSTISARADGG